MWKLIISILFILVGTINSFATITGPVQEKASNNWTTGTSFTISGISSPTNGNFGVIYFDGSTNTAGITSITQTGATWTSAVVQSAGSRRAEVWYTSSVFSSGGTTITVNLNFTPSLAAGQSAAYSEWSSTGGLTVDATANAQANSATVDAGPITPTSGRNALIIMGSRIGGAYSSGPTNSFTQLTSADAGVRGYGAYLLTSPTSGAYSTSFTAGSGAWGAAIASFVEPVVVSVQSVIGGNSIWNNTIFK